MNIAAEQVPGVYRRRVGEVLVTALLDGSLVMPPEVCVGATPEEQDALRRAAGLRPPFAGVINTFMLQWADRTVLIDAGAGHTMGPSAGKLCASLRAAGVMPDDVSAILMTHLHADHAGGLTDTAGAPAFPNAELHLSEAELAHWTSDAARDAAPEFLRSSFDLARRNIASYATRTRRFITGEVLSHLQAVPLPGHTPGHTGYLIESEGEKLLIWGDAMSVPAVQAPWPDVSLIFDTDPELGISTRRGVLERAVTEDLLVAGMHLPFPGFSRVAKAGDGFVIQPEPWALLA